MWFSSLPRGTGVPCLLMMRVPILLMAFPAVMAFEGLARAETGDPVAETLFRDGQRLVEQRRYAEACPKFAESQKREPAPGTLLHLGDCYENNAQLATAWATYVEAANVSRSLGKKVWAENADARAKALEPRLPKLTIAITEAHTGLEVRRDGAILSPATFTTPIPTDPGEHVFEATAPGRVAWKQNIVLVERQRTEVRIPSLLKDLPLTNEIVRAPSPELPQAGAQVDPNHRPATTGASPLRPAGFVALGLGGVGLAVGAVVGGLALSDNSRAVELCPNAGICGSRDGVDASERSKTVATVSTVTLISGAVLVAAGVIMVLAARPSATRATSDRSTDRRYGNLFYNFNIL